MHLSLPRAIMASLVAAPFAYATVSLSSFTPSIDNLPSPCQGAYTTVIEGCQPSDFQLGVRCSSACVQGLIKVNNLVTSQCADVDVAETSIIGVFLLGKGIEALCPGVTVTTISSSSSPQTSSTSAAQVSSTEQAQSSPSPSPSSTGEVIQADPNPTTLINSPNQPVVQPTADDTSTAAPRQTADLQKSNKDSGGGSPFDVVATGSSTQLALEDFFKPTLIALAICIGFVL